MNIISVSKSVIFTLLSFCVTSVQGSETSKLKIPNTFNKNQVISSEEMNTNFTRIETAVNDLDGRLGSLNDSLGARSQFVGFSASTVTGEVGIFAMQKLCNAEHSGRHVCNTTEVAQSTYDANVNDALTTGSQSWILVDIRSALSQPDVDRQNAPRALSCDGWMEPPTGASYKGMTVTAKGVFKTADCKASHHVACCELKSP